jgi:hypothetical protein
MDRISAFMDGETSHTEAHQVILRLKQYEEDGETWKTFHLIGDVLRGEPLMSPVSPSVSMNACSRSRRCWRRGAMRGERPSTTGCPQPPRHRRCRRSHPRAFR